MLKRFMFAAIGVLALALAFHLGGEMARAGATGRFVSIAGFPQFWMALTEDGQWWHQDSAGGVWIYGGMIGGATAVEPSTWGQVKHRAGQ